MKTNEKPAQTAAPTQGGFKGFIARCIWKVGSFCHHPDKTKDNCCDSKENCPRKSECQEEK